MSDVVLVDGEDTQIVVETIEDVVVYTPDASATPDIVEVSLGVIEVDGETTEIVVETIEQTVIYTPEETSVEILTVGEQGPPGAMLDTSKYIMPVTVAISGHRAVRSDGAGNAVYASSDALLDANALLGISINAASPGGSVTVQHSGKVMEPGWSWTPNLPVFCGPNGALTQTPPETGFCLVVGIPTTPTTLCVGVKQPIITA